MNRQQGKHPERDAENRTTPPPAQETDQALNRAVQHFQAGELDQAAQILEDIRRTDPHHFDATHGLGVIHAARGDLDAAVPLFENAVSIRPGDAEAHHNLGRALANHGRLDEAIAAFRRSLEIAPDVYSSHVMLGNLLNDKGDLFGATACYRRAIEVNPGMPDAYNNIGNILSSQGDHNAAAVNFEKALEIDPRFPGAEMSLRRSRQKQVQGWHLVMLADEGRNTAFQRAIEKAVSPSSHVLEIGTGSALLAMMAAKAGAAEVIACERSGGLADLARQVVRKNGYADRITILDKDSTQLCVGVDMERPADVLVSEIVDAGLLGEGVLPTIRHARQYLTTPDATVIPKSAEVFGMLVEMPALRAVNPPRTVAGFDLTPFAVFWKPIYKPVNLEMQDHRCLSKTFSVARFDLTQPPHVTPDSPHQSRLDVEAVADGNVHAVVFWFDLHVDDEITLSTSPASRQTHWEQALQFFEEDIPVQKGQSLSIGVTWSDQGILFSR